MNVIRFPVEEVRLPERMVGIFMNATDAPREVVETAIRKVAYRESIKEFQSLIKKVGGVK